MVLVPRFLHRLNNLLGHHSPFLDPDDHTYPFHRQRDYIYPYQNKIYLIFPRLEEGRKRLTTTTVKNKNKAIKMLFDNISQKISETFILYDSIPVLGFEEKEATYKRLKSLQYLIKIPNLSQIAIRLSNPKNCWENLLQGE